MNNIPCDTCKNTDCKVCETCKDNPCKGCSQFDKRELCSSCSLCMHVPGRC